MRPGLYLRYALWESRGSIGHSSYFVACLAVGVAAVVAVSSLATSVDRGVRREAKQLLAADLAVRARRPLPAELDAVVAELPGARRTEILELVTLVAAPGLAPTIGLAGRSQLVELKVVEGTYPFYGTLELEPAVALEELLTDDSAVVAPDVLKRLDLGVGDALNIGGEPFDIVGTVLSEPDRITSAFSMGPRVFMTRAAFDRTPLGALGSRISYTALIKLHDDADALEVESAAESLKHSLPAADFARVESYTEAQPRLRRGLSRLDSYLGLVALLSLLVGGVGVAQAVRAWMAGRLDAIATLKCLGVRPREVFAIFLSQAVALGLLGSLAGAVAGVALQSLVPYLLAEVVPGHLIRAWQPTAILRGLALGLGVALVFSIPPLITILRVPPARVLRRDAEPLPGARWVPAAAALIVVFAIGTMAILQSRSIELALQFTGGVVLTGLALSLAAWLVANMTGRLPREFGRVWLRHGLAALARPGAATVGAIVALGLGLLVVLTMGLVERHLSDQLAAELPEHAPSAFLIDIQPDQWAGVRNLLDNEGAIRIESVPVVVTRLSTIDGRAVGALAAATTDRGRRWALTREQRLTYMQQLPPDNQILRGRLWNDPDAAEVSLEREFAAELDVDVGSSIGFDVQGVPLELEVTSIRSVDWESFGINFYLVVEPGILEDAPQSRLATARLPAGREQAIQDLLAASFPNVTMIRIREMLDKIIALLTRLGVGVRVLGGFTVVTGLAILAGAIAAGSIRRGREVALLKTLGMTRQGVVAAFATEYALVGLVAGTIGGVGGTFLAWLIVTRSMEIEWVLYPASLGAVVASGVVLSVVAGIAASFRALRRRPIEALRAE